MHRLVWRSAIRPLLPTVLEVQGWPFPQYRKECFEIIWHCRNPNLSTTHLCFETNWSWFELDRTLLGNVGATPDLHSPQVLNKSYSARYVLILSAPRLIRRECFSSATFASKPRKSANHASIFTLRLKRRRPVHFAMYMSPPCCSTYHALRHKA